MYLMSLEHPTDIGLQLGGLLSLQQVREEGECIYFFSFFTFIHLSSPLLSLLFSPFLWETTQNDTQG